MAKTVDARIEAAKEEIKQKEALIKKLLQQQKAQERKERNHRLCKRGGLVEKLLPGLIKLSDEQFQTFVDKTLLTGFAEKILRGLVPLETEPGEADNGTDTGQSSDSVTPHTTEPQEQKNAAPAPKPTATAQGNTTGGKGENPGKIAS
jgi:hypothetical protein